jgi:hypothetical protein
MNDFSSMTSTDLHHFQQAMAQAKKAEAKEAKTKAWKEQEGARINTLRNSILSKMNAKQPDPMLLTLKENKLINTMREFELIAPTLGDLAKKTHHIKIKSLASEVIKLTYDRDRFRDIESSINDVPVAHKDIFGEDAGGLNEIVAGIKSHRAPEDMPKLDKAHIIERAQGIVFDPTSEPPAEWQPTPSE